MTAGLYRIERLYITLWYEWPIQGMVVVEGGQAFLFDSKILPNQHIGTTFMFGQIDPKFAEEFESSDEFYRVETPKVRGMRMKALNSALADESFQSCLPSGYGFMRDGFVEIQSTIPNFPPRILLGRWRYPVENLERHQQYPEVLNVEMNYIFDWYDGPIQGLIILNDGRHLLYEQSEGNSGRPRAFMFGELSFQPAIASLTNRIKGHPRGWNSNMIWLNIGRQKVQSAFNMAKVEHHGVMDHGVNTTLLGSVSNVSRRELFCGWGGNPTSPRVRGTV